MSEVQKKRLAIIDGKSVFYRGYYAMPNLSTKDGTPTGGVFGFATMALEVLKKLQPDYVAVAWDKPKTNIRKRLKLYPEYKAGRKPAPPDFYEQIPVLHELLTAFGWPLYELDDYEADDIMGTLAVQATKKDIQTMLVTSDLDVLQLIDLHVKVFALKKGLSNIELYSPESFTAKYGLDAHQFLDLKALKGDSSDNIPGVPGIGEKTAIELLKQFKTLDGVYENIDLIKDSVRAKLVAGKKLAYLSKKIGAIWTDAPIKLNLKEVDGSKVDPHRILEILQKLEFRSLAQRLPEVMKVPTEAGISNKENGIWVAAKSKLYVIDKTDQLKSLDFSSTKELVVHSRSAGKHGKNPQLLILSPDPETIYAIDLTKLPNRTLIPYSIFLFPPSVPLVGYDVKSTLKVLLELGMPLPAVGHDVQMGAFLLNSLRREQTLTELAQAELNYEGSSLENLDTEELTHRAPEVIAAIRALYEQQKKALALNSKLQSLASTIEWPLIPVLARMEYAGIELNTKYLKKFAVELDDSISDLEQQIYGHADQEFNISSPAQLADILFVKLNLPKEGIKRGKTGYSTAAAELDKLRGLHPIIDLITQYREVTKLKNTYVDTLPKVVDENSRVHTTFAITVAPTGRLSSNDPNLQNIPTRTDLGRRIRTAFVAGKGKQLISADYSQFELRLAAAISGDKDMIDAFNNDEDIHRLTASQILGIKPSEVTSHQRYQAKAVNFGTMYGQGPHALAQLTGISFAQAKEFISKYFEIRPKLKQFLEETRRRAEHDGFIETLFGRRRPTPDVHSSNFVIREAAMRQAVNMPFQGTAADIMKMAMIKIQENLDHEYGISNKEKGGIPEMLLQIHDSILVEAPIKEAERVAKLLKDTMENVYKLPVKLTVDTSIGQNWGEL